MSRFRKSTAMLAGITRAPLFVGMRDTGIVRPMVCGIHREIEKLGITCDRGTPASNALAMLSRSKRYREAIVAEGSMRHDLDGVACQPVDELARGIARAQLAMRAERARVKNEGGPDAPKEAA